MQAPQQSVEDWIIKVKELSNEVKRYGPEIPFQRFAEQILIGTKATSFIIHFRQVFRPLNPMLRPTVRSYEEFEVWFESWKRQQREIERQRERQKQISGKQPGKAGPGKAAGPTPKKPSSTSRDDGKKAAERGLQKEKLDRLKKRLFPKDNTPKTRLPHSRLFRKGRRREPPDMSKIKCYNCGKLGHYASKCPEAKRERTPLMEAYLCGLSQPVSSDEEDLSDPAITSVDDAIKDASDRFANSLRTLVGGMQLAEDAEQDDEVLKDNNLEGPEDDGIPDTDSVFTYASAEINQMAGIASSACLISKTACVLSLILSVLKIKLKGKGSCSSIVT